MSRSCMTIVIVLVALVSGLSISEGTFASSTIKWKPGIETIKITSGGTIYSAVDIATMYDDYQYMAAQRMLGRGARGLTYDLHAVIAFRDDAEQLWAAAVNQKTQVFSIEKAEELGDFLNNHRGVAWDILHQEGEFPTLQKQFDESTSWAKTARDYWATHQPEDLRVVQYQFDTVMEASRNNSESWAWSDDQETASQKEIPMLGVLVEKKNLSYKIVKIRPKGPMDKKAKLGDRIVAVNKQAFTDVEQFNESLRERGEGTSVSVATRSGPESARVFVTESVDVVLSRGSAPNSQAEIADLSPQSRFTAYSNSSETSFADLHQFVKPMIISLYKGDFEALQAGVNNIYGQSMHLEKLAAELLGTKDSMDDHYRNSKVPGLISQYIFVKSQTIGLCGESSKKYRIDRQEITVWRNGFGMETARIPGSKSSTFFEVPSRFSEIVESTNLTGRDWRITKGMDRFILKAGGCGSPFLDRLEKNMVTLFNS